MMKTWRLRNRMDTVRKIDLILFIIIPIFCILFLWTKFKIIAGMGLYSMFLLSIFKYDIAKKIRRTE